MVEQVGECSVSVIMMVTTREIPGSLPILYSVRRKDVKKRSLGNVDFTLGDGVVFSLNM